MPPKVTHTPEMVERLRINEGREMRTAPARSPNRGNGSNRDFAPTKRERFPSRP